MLRIHDPSIFKYSSVILGAVTARGMVPTFGIKPTWRLRRPFGGVVSDEDIQALARLYAPVAAELDTKMPPGVPRRPSRDALEANVVTFGHDRKFQTEASVTRTNQEAFFYLAASPRH